jgi:hypothetical protein
MRPTVSEQLSGISALLVNVVAPHLDDDYARGILLGAANALTTLSATWHAIPGFLMWDSTITAIILDLVGPPAPPPPGDRFDIPALEKHHREVRELLEQSMPIILESATARAATVALFRERAERFTSIASTNN